MKELNPDGPLLGVSRDVAQRGKESPQQTVGLDQLSEDKAAALFETESSEYRVGHPRHWSEDGDRGKLDGTEAKRQGKGLRENAWTRPCY